MQGNYLIGSGRLFLRHFNYPFFFREIFNKVKQIELIEVELLPQYLNTWKFLAGSVILIEKRGVGVATLNGGILIKKVKIDSEILSGIRFAKQFNLRLNNKVDNH